MQEKSYFDYLSDPEKEMYEAYQNCGVIDCYDKKTKKINGPDHIVESDHSVSQDLLKLVIIPRSLINCGADFHTYTKIVQPFHPDNIVEYAIQNIWLTYEEVTWIRMLAKEVVRNERDDSNTFAKFNAQKKSDPYTIFKMTEGTPPLFLRAVVDIYVVYIDSLLDGFAEQLKKSKDDYWCVIKNAIQSIIEGSPLWITHMNRLFQLTKDTLGDDVKNRRLVKWPYSFSIPRSNSEALTVMYSQWTSISTPESEEYIRRTFTPSTIYRIEDFVSGKIEKMMMRVRGYEYALRNNAERAVLACYRGRTRILPLEISKIILPSLIFKNDYIADRVKKMKYIYENYEG